MTKQEKDWEAESAGDTLVRAEEIRNNPVLYKKAMAVLLKKEKALDEALHESSMSIRQNRKNQV